VVVLGLGHAVDVDRGAGGRHEPPVTRDVVGMVVRLEDVLDLHAQVARQPQVLVDVELRVDYGGDARVLVADQIAGAAEVVVDELPKDHAGPSAEYARRAELDQSPLLNARCASRPCVGNFQGRR
jgi:hypothetical protein